MVQRRHAVTVTMLHVRSIEKPIEAPHVALARSGNQRGPAIVVHWVDGRPVFQQHINALVMATCTCHKQRRYAFVRGTVCICAVLQQESQEGGVPELGSDMQRSRPSGCGFAGIHPMLQ